MTLCQDIIVVALTDIDPRLHESHQCPNPATVECKACGKSLCGACLFKHQSEKR